MNEQMYRSDFSKALISGFRDTVRTAANYHFKKNIIRSNKYIKIKIKAEPVVDARTNLVRPSVHYKNKEPSRSIDLYLIKHFTRVVWEWR